MGWSGGTDIVREVGQSIRDHVSSVAVRRKLYRALVDACEAGDWDCQDEATGIDPILDDVLGLGDQS